jgi:Flp pilus assembly protein TadG
MSRNSDISQDSLLHRTGQATRTRFRNGRNRQGAAVVEFALVAPLFFLLVFGIIEFGRLIMVQ